MMDRVRLIGLTGGIGSGKSAAAKILEELGAYIIDADILARKVVEPNSLGAKRLEEEFGSRFFAKGVLDRRAFREFVFTDAERVLRLNAILHDLVKAELMREIELAPRDKIVVAVVPLLHEAGWGEEFDEVWAIAADVDTRIKRVGERDNISRENTLAVIESQMKDAERTDAILIDNNGTLAELEERLVSEFKRICKTGKVV